MRHGSVKLRHRLLAVGKQISIYRVNAISCLGQTNKLSPGESGATWVGKNKTLASRSGHASCSTFQLLTIHLSLVLLLSLSASWRIAKWSRRCPLLSFASYKIELLPPTTQLPPYALLLLPCAFLSENSDTLWGAGRWCDLKPTLRYDEQPRHLNPFYLSNLAPASGSAP